MVAKSTMMPTLRILSLSVMKMELIVWSFRRTQPNLSRRSSNNKKNNSSNHVEHGRWRERSRLPFQVLVVPMGWKALAHYSIINCPQKRNVWYRKSRIGENSIGLIMKSVASCLKTDKKITNHSMWKILVQKLKKCSQPRDVIMEITCHASVESLKDYDTLDENQLKNLSHMISRYRNSKSNTSVVEQQWRPLTAYNPPPVDSSSSSSNINNAEFQNTSQSFASLSNFNFKGTSHFGPPQFSQNFLMNPYAIAFQIQLLCRNSLAALSIFTPALGTI